MLILASLVALCTYIRFKRRGENDFGIRIHFDKNKRRGGQFRFDWSEIKRTSCSVHTSIIPLLG